MKSCLISYSSLILNLPKRFHTKKKGSHKDPFLCFNSSYYALDLRKTCVFQIPTLSEEISTLYLETLMVL